MGGRLCVKLYLCFFTKHFFPISLATKSLYVADLIHVGMVTDFVPRLKHGDLEIALAAAAACPPPHTDKGL